MPAALAIATIIATLAPLVEKALTRGEDLTPDELAQAAAATDALYAIVQAQLNQASQE